MTILMAIHNGGISHARYVRSIVALLDRSRPLMIPRQL
jgi:hypothetical protein